MENPSYCHFALAHHCRRHEIYFGDACISRRSRVSKFTSLKPPPLLLTAAQAVVVTEGHYYHHRLKIELLLVVFSGVVKRKKVSEKGQNGHSVGT